jgi:D-3-phosphoglycerate dehydrogenase
MHILVSDNLAREGLDVLEKAEGISLHASGKMSRDEVLAVIDQADGMIVRSGTKADKELLEKASKLKAIVRAGVGVDNIHLPTATERGIVVMNTPAGNTIATAELTLGLMISLARHIPQAQAALVGGHWDRKAYMGTELRDKTLGIIGFGRVGQAVAKRAQVFEMDVITYDPNVDRGIVDAQNVKLVTLDELFAQADYISLHAVASPETDDMINAWSIAKMKDGVRIINAARGTLVNAGDLAKAIKTGKVAGAALDVYEVEPPPANHPLIGLPQVIDTPHLGASTKEAQIAVAVEAAETLLNALLHQDYRNVVNEEVLEL